MTPPPASTASSTNTDEDYLALHGRFDDPPREADDRVAFGVYTRPVLDDHTANMLRRVLGADSELGENIEAQADRDTSADVVEKLVQAHPVWSVETPETIIAIEVVDRWRDRWDTVLNYNTDDDDETTVSIADDFDAPPVDEESQFALHYIDGQDMHLKTKLVGMTTAESYGAALRDFSGFYDAFSCPSNWEFELVRIDEEHEYDADSFDLPDNPDDP